MALRTRQPSVEMRKRKSSEKRLSNAKVSRLSGTSSLSNDITTDEESLNPESLALRLDRYCTELASSHKNEYCDLADFDFEDGVENLERLRELREEIQNRLSHFDFAGRTDVNFDSAAIAGAKVFMEERAATRSITKRLTDNIGINESSILYNGLPYEGFESSAVKDIHEQRTESIVESFVDFQKQLKFKLNVLGHAIKKIENNSHKVEVFPDRISKRKAKEEKRQAVMKNAIRTPKKRRKEVNPFSFNKIIDEYALEVASEVTSQTANKRKNLTPIPLDLSVLDDDSLYGDENFFAADT